MNHTLLDIRPEQRRIVVELLCKHVPDRAVMAFGSRVTGKAKPFSDLDLAIMGDTPLPPAVSAALADDFSESDLPFKVDIVDWATTGEAFRKIIARDGVLLIQIASESGS